jgi:hypothetical protein
MHAMHPCAVAGAVAFAEISGPASRRGTPAGSGWSPNDAAIERQTAAPSAMRARRERFVLRSIMFAKPAVGILFLSGPGGAAHLHRMAA